MGKFKDKNSEKAKGGKAMQWTGEVIGPPEPELCPLLSESSYLAGQATHNDFLRTENLSANYCATHI